MTHGCLIVTRDGLPMPTPRRGRLGSRRAMTESDDGNPPRQGWQDSGSKSSVLGRTAIIATMLVGALTLLAATSVAQERPVADATPGAVGVSGVPLGAIDPVVAPGYRLQVVELTWDPGAYTTRHF